MLVNQKRVEEILDAINSSDILDISPEEIYDREWLLKELKNININFKNLVPYGCPSDWFEQDDLCVKEIGFKLDKTFDLIPEEIDLCSYCWKEALTLNAEEEREEYKKQSEDDNLFDINIKGINDYESYDLNNNKGGFLMENKDIQAQKEKKGTSFLNAGEPAPCVMLPLEMYNELYKCKSELQEYHNCGLTSSGVEKVLEALNWEKGDDLNTLLETAKSITQIVDIYKK